MTGQALIESSLRLIERQESGENPSSAELNDALDIMNQLIDSWNAERLTIFQISRSVFTLAGSTQTRTYGDGGQFDDDRPAKIERVSVITDYAAGSGGVESGTEYPLEYTTDPARWQAVAMKSSGGSLPSICFDDCGFPLRTLKFYPYASSSVSVAIYAWEPLTQFASLTDDLTFPPGYLKALRYNLAVDLAPEFGAVLRPEVAAQAVMSKAVIKSLNIPELSLQCDPAVSSGYGAGFIDSAAFNRGF